ncbi:MAG: SDR family NAD(P)-dependent oxidoreductase [Minwuia sp.]|uniref:SDR family NAD(P)-dependent oxidoreductase n=1 Tax=Minwuia sp. TaxID=2493630 RepID=UPI003A893A89
MKRLEGRVAVVTGGASGIGFASVERLAAEGARVVITDLNEATGKAAVQRMADAGHAEAVDLVCGDVADEAHVADAMDRAIDRWGRLDIAFLNAGVGGAFGSLLETAVEDWDQTFAYLTRSVFLGIKHAGKRMGEGGSIIATASIAGLGGGAGSHGYSAAKAAVISLTRTAAMELGPRRIRVNAIAPGVISTPLAHRGKESNLEALCARQPWPDTGQPADIAAALAFLASDDARFVTGETVTVDGGLRARSSDVLGDNSMLLAGRTGMNRGSTGLKSGFRNTDR